MSELDNAKLSLEDKKGNSLIVTEITFRETPSPRFIVKKKIDTSCEGGGVVRNTTTVYYKPEFSSFYRENIACLNVNKYFSQKEKEVCLVYNRYLQMHLT